MLHFVYIGQAHNPFGLLVFQNMFDQDIISTVARKYADLGFGVGGGNLSEIIGQVKIQCVFTRFLQLDKMGALAETQQGFHQTDGQHFVLYAYKQPNMDAVSRQVIQVLRLDVFKVYE